MKFKNIILLLAIMTCVLYHGIAREPLHFSVIPQPPFPPTAGEYIDNPASFMQVILTNTGRSTQQFYLSIKLEMLMPGNALVEVPHNIPPSQPLTIEPFQTLVLNQMHYDQMLGHLSYNDLHRKGIDEHGYADGTLNLLPEGLYQICFTAFDFNAPFGQIIPVSSKMGACATFYICYAASAPVLATPVNCNMELLNDTIQPDNPFMISWMPPAFNCTGAVANFNYALKIVEVMPGQDMQTAIDFNPVALQLENMMVATLPLDTNMYPGVFRHGERYAMQVTATAGIGSDHILIQNEGISPICSFVWGGTPLPDEDPADDPPAPDPDPDEPDDPLDIIADDDTSESSDPQCVAETPVNTDPFEGNLDGQQVQVGLFTMQVTQAIQIDGRWTGTGRVNWNPRGAPLRVRVEFENIRVNTSMDVFEGAVFSQPETELDDYIPRIVQRHIDWAETQYNTAEELAQHLRFNIPEQYNQRMTEYTNYIGQTSKLIHELSGDINLPVNLESLIPGTNIDIGIVGMVFTPHVARMNTFSAFRVPEAASGTNNSQWLAFLGHGMCFTPNIVVSPNEANLFLASDFEIDIGSGFRLTFKKSSTLGDLSDGTFISWNNDGFEQGMITLDVQLPSSIRGENPDGTPNNERISVHFETWFSDWNDWIATASVPPFQVQGLSGFRFSANKIVYDHSVERNPEGISFPPHPGNGEDYGAGGNSWKGFWLDDLQVLLPPDFKSTEEGNPRTSISLNQLLIDNQGVTLDMFALHPLQTGVLGGCAFSIDTIQVNMYKTTDFIQAKMGGGITIPVVNDPLPYQGMLSWDGDEINYHFVVKPTNDISMPAWIASLNIYESSGLEVVKDEHGAAVSFLLHGDISLDSQYAVDIPLVFSFSGIEFQNMGVSNRNPENNSPEFFLSAGTWSQTSPQKSIGPFGVNIDTPSPHFTGGEFGLKINAGFSVVSAFSCNTSLDVVGTLDWNVADNLLPTGLELKNVHVDEVEISGNFGPVVIDGLLRFYRDDPVFGGGMRGEVSAVFDPAISIQAVAQFGRVDDFTYWYVDAMANFSPTLPLVGPAVQLGGFGGGVYYNMERHTEPQFPGNPTEPVIPDLDDIHASSSGVEYVPKKNSWGFNAAITLTIAEAHVLNGTFSLACSFNGKSFNNILIEGSAYLLTDYPANANYLANADIEIQYSRKDNLLTMYANAEASFLFTSVSIPIRFEAEGSNWYFMVGDPHGDRVTATLIDVKRGPLQAFLEANCYFALGNSLPNTNLPPPPYQIVQFLNLHNLDQHRGSLETIPEKGMMFGAGIHGELDISLIVYAHLVAIAGFDVALLHYQDAECNNEPMGFYGWYGLGQVYGYFHGDVGIEIDVWFFKGSVSLMQLTAGAFLRGGMPNPFWAKGRARVRGRVLGGLINISTTLSLDVGEVCLPPVGDPLADIRVFEDIQPGFATLREAEEAEPESVFTIPRITANIDMSDFIIYPHKITIPPSDENEHGEIREYSFYVHSIILYPHISEELPENPAGGIPLDYSIGSGPNRKQIVVQLDGRLDENTTYAIRAVSSAKQRIWTPEGDEGYTSSWELPYIDGTQQERHDTLITYFRTGDLPMELENNVLVSTPLNGQRFFPRGEDYSITLIGDMSYIFQDDDFPVETWIRKTRAHEGEPLDSPQQIPYTLSENGRLIQLNVNKSLLNPQEVYEISVIRRNLALQQQYLEQMAREQRRMILKNLATGHEVTHTLINYEDAEVSNFIPPELLPDPDYEHVTTPGNIVFGAGTSGYTQPAGDDYSAEGEQEYGGGDLLQPGFVRGNLLHGSSKNFGEILDPLTIDEYNQKYLRDTLDFREQVLVDEFESEHIEILFNIIFATSEHATLQDKVNAFGPLLIANALSSEQAESEFATEPFEQADLIGINYEVARLRGYHTSIPPLLRFRLPFAIEDPGDRAWRTHFYSWAYDVYSYCGPPAGMNQWRPRPNSSVALGNKLDVDYGNSSNIRSDTYFPHDYWGYHRRYPGWNRSAFHTGGASIQNLEYLLSQWEQSTNPNASLRLAEPDKLYFDYLITRDAFYSDYMAARRFIEAFNDQAEMYLKTDGQGRNEMTDDFIADMTLIAGQKGEVFISMPAYQLSWFHWISGNGAADYGLEPTMEPWLACTSIPPFMPELPGFGYAGNFIERPIRIEFLNMSANEFTGDPNSWNYNIMPLLNMPLKFNY